jgi:streptogramin lyase
MFSLLRSNKPATKKRRRKASQQRPSLEVLEDRRLLSGGISEFTIPRLNSGPRGIVAGPDGNLWFTETLGKRIGQIATQGAFTGEWPAATPGNGGPQDITVGSDNNLWYTGWGSGLVGRITTAGEVTEWETAHPFEPFAITSGPDGQLWFTMPHISESNPGKIGMIDPSNPNPSIMELPPLPSDDTYPVGITTGPDGNI